jgi:hypothetical protein
MEKETHSNDDDRTCSNCGKCFTFPSQLRRHFDNYSNISNQEIPDKEF